MLEEEFSGIPAAIEVLQQWFEAGAIDQMVEEQPLFLVEDIETAISSLNRYNNTRGCLSCRAQACKTSNVQHPKVCRPCYQDATHLHTCQNSCKQSGRPFDRKSACIS